MAELLGDDGMTPAELDEAFTWFDKASGVQVGSAEITRQTFIVRDTSVRYLVDGECDLPGRCYPYLEP